MVIFVANKLIKSEAVHSTPLTLSPSHPLTLSHLSHLSPSHLYHETFPLPTFYRSADARLYHRGIVGNIPEGAGNLTQRLF